MSEMVERAIGAIRPIMDDLVEDYTFTDSAIEKVVRGVVEAMREPTDGQCKAGASKWDDDWCTETNALNMWQAMIDEALK